MRVLRSIVAPLTTLMSSCETKFTGCCRIRFEIVRDELVWDKAILLQKLVHEFQRGTLVPPSLDQHVEDLALGVDGAPQIDHPAIDFSDRFRPDAKSYGVWVGVCAGPLRQSAQNGSPCAGRSHRRP